MPTLEKVFVLLTPAFGRVMFSGRLSSLQAYTFLGANGNCGTSVSLNRVKQLPPAEERQIGLPKHANLGKSFRN
jgi:hypothetical protein